MKPTMRSLWRRAYWCALDHHDWDMLGLLEGICALLTEMLKRGQLNHAEWYKMSMEIKAHLVASRESGEILRWAKYLAEHGDWTDRLPFLWLLSISDTDAVDA